MKSAAVTSYLSFNAFTALSAIGASAWYLYYSPGGGQFCLIDQHAAMNPFIMRSFDREAQGGTQWAASMWIDSNFAFSHIM